MNNRRKGITFELKIRKIFISLGFTGCKTTRESSRLLDSCKVDLNYIPWLVQIKKGYQNNRPKYETIYNETKAALLKNFPKNNSIHIKPIVLIHQITGYKPEHYTWTFQGDYIVLLLQHFFELIKEKWSLYTKVLTLKNKKMIKDLTNIIGDEEKAKEVIKYLQENLQEDINNAANTIQDLSEITEYDDPLLTGSVWSKLKQIVKDLNDAK